MTLLTHLGTLSYFSTFKPPVGGKFPRATYDAIIDQIQQILINVALIAQMAQSLQTQQLPQETLAPDRALGSRFREYLVQSRLTFATAASKRFGEALMILGDVLWRQVKLG